ncbi:ATP-binding protein [Niveibacterium terrae]|uniref:ATP-binding protein n=1 Tax=Niveibacterium terrae TaxID=3373598 RepID=UPI003A8CDEDA
MHPLLTHQIEKHLQEGDLRQPRLQTFLNAVEQSYRHFEEDAQLNERAIEQINQELNERNAALRLELQSHRQTEAELLREKAEQANLIQEVEQAHNRLLLSEKLASIGQLAAGVAHEINNPIGYVYSNIGSLSNYVKDLIRLLDAHIEHSAGLPENERSELAALAQEIDYDYLREDITSLTRESTEGIERVRKIVQDLKDFSRTDSNEEWQWADLHHGIESTLNIVNNEIKYRADVIREFGELPQIECLPSQLNQVFMNLLVNAAHAMREDRRGTIRVCTGSDEKSVWVEIADNGCGIPEGIRDRIFDPFYTTKPIGKGTGLGLSLAYGIIRKHDGQIEVTSQEGLGSTFRVSLPIHHHHEEPHDA